MYLCLFINFIIFSSLAFSFAYVDLWYITEYLKFKLKNALLLCNHYEHIW
jgi:hypothetical protein